MRVLAESSGTPTSFYTGMFFTNDRIIGQPKKEVEILKDIHLRIDIRYDLSASAATGATLFFK